MLNRCVPTTYLFEIFHPDYIDEVESFVKRDECLFSIVMCLLITSLQALNDVFEVLNDLRANESLQPELRTRYIIKPSITNKGTE